MVHVELVHVEKAPNGFFIKHDSGYVHLTADWADAIHRDQFAIHGTTQPQLNRLRYELRYGNPTQAQVEEWFAAAYGDVVKNRQDRTNLGLKAITRHGHEDLEAVRNGEPVRPWNAADQKSELHEWIRGQREAR